MPVFRLYGPGPPRNIVAADVPGLADALGIWFPSFLALPFKFDPVLLSERIARACSVRVPELRERFPEATRVVVDLHGGFEVRAEQADQLCELLGAELRDVGRLTTEDVKAGNAEYQRALAALDTLEKAERLAHLYLALLHHVLANDLQQLVVTDEQPCETTVLWSSDERMPSPERAWRASKLYRSVENRDDPNVWGRTSDDDPDQTVELATLLAALVPWSPARHLQLARVLSRREAPESTIIHATEALLLAELAEIPDEVRAELHAMRAVAWDRAVGRHPRAEEHAAREILAAYELGFQFDRETTRRWIERYSR
ncbi:MAG: hypothetical protein AB7O24_06265 [Kofleriaceae bacterium]